MHGQTVDRNDWRLVGLMHVAETREQAYRDVEHGIEQWFQLLPAGRRVPADGRRRRRRQGDDRLHQRGRASARSAPVEDARRQVQKLWDQSGGFGAMLLLAHEWANPEATKRSYELIAQHVAPQFQGGAHHARPGHAHGQGAGHRQARRLLRGAAEGGRDDDRALRRRGRGQGLTGASRARRRPAGRRRPSPASRRSPCRAARRPPAGRARGAGARRRRPPGTPPPSGRTRCGSARGRPAAEGKRKAQVSVVTDRSAQAGPRQLPDPLLRAPGDRGADPLRRRDVAPDRAEHVADHAVRRPAGEARSGRRCCTPGPARGPRRPGPGANIAPIVESTTSNSASRTGSAWASATWVRSGDAVGARRAARPRPAAPARSRWPARRRSGGPQRSEALPLPAATSRTRSPACTSTARTSDSPIQLSRLPTRP